MSRLAARAGPASIAAVALAATLPQGLHAQTQPTPDAPRERTGPTAQPPVLPPYAQPREAPATAPPAEATAPPAPAQGGGSIREVRIVADGEPTGGMPPPAWHPPQDSVSGLTIDHRPGEPLGLDWVKRQFAANIGQGGASVSTAVALVQLINRAYVTAGFVNTGLVVPQQTALQQGVLKLRLIYGGLVPGSTGGEPFSVAWGEGGSGGLREAYVRERFPAAGRRPLSAYEVEREFRLLAENPAVRTVNVDLRPSGRPGEASLHVLVHPARRFDLYTGYANERSPSVGSERLSLGGYFRNLVASGDILTAEVGTTKGIEDAQAGYSTPVIDTRTMLNLRASFNNAAVIDRPLLPLDISAKDRAFEGGLTRRFIEEPLSPTESPGRWSPSRTLSAGFLVAHRLQKSYLLGQPFSFAPGSKDGRSAYTALRLLGDYLVRNVDQVFAVSLTGTLGLGGTESDVPGIRNPSQHFGVLLAQVNYARRLNEEGLELRGRLTGQIATGILYSGERLSIGGESSVRGYRENLFLVDDGAIGSVELAQSFSLSGKRAADRAFDWGAFGASLFADGAYAHNADPPQPSRRFIASVGASLRWNPSDFVQARLSYGYALRDVQLPGSRDLQDRGFHFRVTLYPLQLLSLGRSR
ncbi:MAG TPA: ShlB/FhaC/HecB family hemolysin secretion/activation protein [Allosphingosinicella sp.]